MKLDKMMIIRTALLAMALVNQVLFCFGKNPLPITNEQLTTWVTIIFSVTTSAWAWWKNNDVTKKARSRAEFIKNMEKGLE